MKNHVVWGWLAYPAMLLIAACSAMGQIAGTGSIQGTVTDPSGAVVPGASVTATNVATGVETSRTTNGAGFYVLSPLPAGAYNLAVTATGFQTVRQDSITVEALATVGLNVELKVGSSTQEVTVEASPTPLRTDDATLGGSMQNKVYEALPLAMGSGVPRDPSQFVGLIPGVTALVTQASGPSYATFNGGRQESNGLYLEGLSLAFPNQQGDTRNIALGISVDAVDQFQAESNGEKAMYQGQGMHNYVLKSGTNRFHGTAFEYFRNTAFDARGFFAASVPVDHQNEFGANLGGPIKKDKIFFFGNYSGYYYNTATTPVYLSLPTMAERSGDFRQLPTIIYDPKSITCAGAVCSKQAFANNTIPQERLSSVSKSFQSYLTAPSNSNLLNNYLSTLPKALHTNNGTEKVDLNLSGKNRMFVVYARGKYATDYTGNLTPTGTALPNPYNSSSGYVIEVPTIAQIHHTYVFSPTLLNNASFGLSRIWIPLYSGTKAGKYAVKAGLTGLPQGKQAGDAFPAISFSGPNSPINWSTTGPFDEAENNFTFQDDLQWVHGRHVFMSGFQITRLQDNRAQMPSDGTSASFSFSNASTAGFSATGSLLNATGNSYAGYMLGAVDSASVRDNYVVFAGARYHVYAAYIQDDWAVNSRLTLNLGLRYDLFGPVFEVADRMSFMNPNMPNPAAGGRLGALNFAGHGAYSCNCHFPAREHYKNFQPRIGLAFKLDNKTVIRAGFMVTATHGAAGIGGNGAAAGSGLAGFNATASFSSPATGLPSFYWDTGVPPYRKPPFLDPAYGVGFTTENPTGAVSMPYVDPNLAGKPPYYLNWSFGLQREVFADTAVGVAYSASVGHFLPGATTAMWTDSMLPKYLALGALLGAQATPQNVAAAQPIMPGIALPFSNFQGTIAQMLKPFPQYSGTSYFSGDLGNSTYNSLMLTLNRRFSQGFASQLGYTWSKELDNIPSAGQLGSAGGTRDPYNGKLDKARGSIDHRHVFHGTFVWSLPLGKGHRLGGGNPVERSLLSGWQVSGIVTFTSGPPLGITGSGCNVTGVSSTCIASYNPSFSGPVRINGSYGNGSVLATSYIDKRAFMNPAPYTFGNLPRSAPFGLFAPYLMDESVSLRREFGILENLKFAITADVFNLTNSVYFATVGTSSSIGTNIDSANFGQVTTSAPARKVQLNARITF